MQHDEVSLPARELTRLLKEAKGVSDELRPYVEMLTRWDMIESPPDILVTNYSMLNVILMREREDRMFTSTARWPV